jgi:hypothetical protein
MTAQKSVENGVRQRAGVSNDMLETSAADFLAALGPANDRWAKGDWLFRGQGNAEWELKPRGLRHGEFERVGVVGGQDSTVHAAITRRDQQMRLLKDFAERLDQVGVSIPSSSPLSDESSHHSLFPPRAWFPLMALAQHHGLPTLLLDWTRRAKFAAYFAAAAVVGGASMQSTHLAVYALDIAQANRSQFMLLRRENGTSAHSILEHYQAPGGTNPNLRAQAGTFTMLASLDDAGIDEHLHRCVEAKTLPASPLRRLLLPSTEAPRLMRLLALDGVDGASMFPGTDGVVRAMREKAVWGPLSDRGGK